jgi:hypothetical protein
MDKKHCIGCSDNFYNGRNNLGVKECWCLKDAKLVKRIEIGYWEQPPYLNKKTITVPDCYHERGSQRTNYVDPRAINSKGYWK